MILILQSFVLKKINLRTAGSYCSYYICLARRRRFYVDDLQNNPAPRIILSLLTNVKFEFGTP